MSDWWSRKLSGQPAAPQRSFTTPPTNMPLRVPNMPEQNQPVQQAQGSPSVIDPSKAPNENVDMGSAIRLWKGGEASKQGMTCPDCGSIYVYSRTARGANTRINGASPAPRCYECGWNGLYDQASQANWSS
jgi:hypothetical protein